MSIEEPEKLAEGDLSPFCMPVQVRCGLLQSLFVCVCVRVQGVHPGVSNERVAYFSASDTYIESLLALFGADQKALMRGSYPKVCFTRGVGVLCGTRHGVKGLGLFAH